MKQSKRAPNSDPIRLDLYVRIRKAGHVRGRGSVLTMNVDNRSELEKKIISFTVVLSGTLSSSQTLTDDE